MNDLFQRNQGLSKTRRKTSFDMQAAHDNLLVASFIPVTKTYRALLKRNERVPESGYFPGLPVGKKFSRAEG